MQRKRFVLRSTSPCECGLRGSGPSRMSDSLTTFVVVLTAYTVELCQAVRVRECVPPRAYGRSIANKAGESECPK